MHRLVPLVSVVLVVACASDASPPMQRWTGTMDTLPSGHVVVRIDDRPRWREDTGWRVVEEVRSIAKIPFQRALTWKRTRRGTVWRW